MHASNLRFAVAVLAAVVLAVRPGVAQDHGAESDVAQALFDQGKALLEKNEIDEACSRLAESQRLEPAIGTLGMLAYCHELQGRTATAWREYLQVAAMPGPNKDRDRRQVARERALALQERLSTLRLEVPSPAPGQVILLGDRRVEEAAWGRAVPIDPGRILVQASAPGRSPWHTTIDISAASTVASLTIPMLEAQASAPPSPLRGAAAPTAGPEQPRSMSWVLPAAAFGMGAVGLGIGTYYGLQTITRNDDSKPHCDASDACDQEGGRLRDEARSSGTIATVGFAVGGAGLAAGAILLLTSTSSKPERKGAVRILPQAGPATAGIELLGVF